MGFVVSIFVWLISCSFVKCDDWYIKRLDKGFDNDFV